MKLPYYAQRYIPWGQKNNHTKHWSHELINKHLKEWSKVLDIWCASWGFYEKWKNKNIQYYWLDYNEDLVKYCTDKWLNVSFFDASTDKIPHPDGMFDFVYCSHVLEHLLSNQQISLFSEISRVLNKWWVLVIFTPTPYSWYFWDDPTHQRPSTHWSLEHLSKDSWLDVVECKYSNIRWFSASMQKWLRLPPLRFFLWEVYLVAKKPF